jgi:type I restriction enzyme M protein
MALKKSDLYSSLWASCDELRGGMDASQYKDYVLFMLFIKYISDKYGDSDDMAPPVTIPPGSSFKDMIALKGQPGHRRPHQQERHPAARRGQQPALQERLPGLQ